MPVYVLAGGASRRFGSDKARALLAGRPLLLHVAARLEPFATRLQVVGAVSDAYADLGLGGPGDLRPGAGPLAGLEAALADAAAQTEPWILVASCDIWGVTEVQLEALLAAPRRGVQAVAWKTADHWQPLWALYRVSLLDEVRRRLCLEQGALWRLLNCVPVQALDGRELNWLQLNRPEALRALQRLQVPAPD